MSRRRASAVILRDDHILMVKITDRGRSWWCLPGGTIEMCETPEQTILRELLEELNLHAEPVERLYEMPMPYEDGDDVGILVRLPNDLPVIGIDRAVADWAWRRLDQIDDAWQVAEVKQAMAARKSTEG